VFNVELVSIAEDELSEAFNWYENQGTDLGNRLFKEINHLLKIIEGNPFYYPVKYPGEIRSASLSKFPYLIIYWVDEANNNVIVLSIFHTSRKPIQF